jgi:tRNA (guanine37-N1)-methyltransferase
VIITILTLFPDSIKSIVSTSILGRAVEKGLVSFEILDIRQFAQDRHRSVDDRPYGGGVGMLMRVDVLHRALCSISRQGKRVCTVLTDPAGTLFTQKKAERYSRLTHLIIVAGHYEGVDARVLAYVDETVSVGKYILTGGEIPALVISDAAVRLIPGVLEKPEATALETYSQSFHLEAPQFTRPEVYQNMRVPRILRSGNHRNIDAWQKAHANKKLTKKRLLEEILLS